MLPKIAVGFFDEKKDFLEIVDIKENAAIFFDCDDASVDDLRRWINNGVGILTNRPNYTLIIWRADKLSAECQSVLLKPIEELGERMNFFLVVENENLILPTVISRSEVLYLQKPKQLDEKYWDEVRKCWSSGPSACISFADKLDKAEYVKVLEEIIYKLKLGLQDEVNKKRLVILEFAIQSMHEMSRTNINPKLLFDNFLLTSWKVIKS